MAIQLEQRKCLPCEGGVSPLGEREKTEFLSQLTGWQIEEGKWLSKTFKFPDFKTAVDEVVRIGALADEENHHPDIYLAWGTVKVRISTHAIGGLSENDFILAAKIDGMHQRSRIH